MSQQIAQQNAQTHFYFCGPASMLNELRHHALELNITSDRIHYELFSTEPTQSASACQLILTQSNVKIEVASDQTLLDAVLDAGIEVPYSCKSGECKSCVVEVSPDADIEHLDNCLTEQERTSGKMCLCVSRPQSQTLTIAL